MLFAEKFFSHNRLSFQVSLEYIRVRSFALEFLYQEFLFGLDFGILVLNLIECVKTGLLFAKFSHMIFLKAVISRYNKYINSVLIYINSVLSIRKRKHFFF